MNYKRTNSEINQLFDCSVMSLKPKRAEESRAEMTIWMAPSDANPAGNVFGGVILRQIDFDSKACCLKALQEKCGNCIN